MITKRFLVPFDSRDFARIEGKTILQIYILYITRDKMHESFVGRIGIESFFFEFTYFDVSKLILIFVTNLISDV